MLVTWNEAKRITNRRKHGLDFAVADQVSQDPLAVNVFDRHVGAEERWHTIGMIVDGTQFRTLVVVHCYPGPDDEEWVHIISLRPADAGEARRYEQIHHL